MQYWVDTLLSHRLNKCHLCKRDLFLIWNGAPFNSRTVLQNLGEWSHLTVSHYSHTAKSCSKFFLQSISKFNASRFATSSVPKQLLPCRLSPWDWLCSASGWQQSWWVSCSFALVSCWSPLVGRSVRGKDDAELWPCCSEISRRIILVQ